MVFTPAIPVSLCYVPSDDGKWNQLICAELKFWVSSHDSEVTLLTVEPLSGHQYPVWVRKQDLSDIDLTVEPRGTLTFVLPGFSSDIPLWPIGIAYKEMLIPLYASEEEARAAV